MDGWTEQGNRFDVYKGTYYNPKWKTGQVLELDSKVNSIIAQTITLSPGKYQL